MEHLQYVAGPQGRSLLRCARCGATSVVDGRSEHAFALAHAQCRGRVGLGDLVAAGTSALGVKPCAPCKQRQAMLNRAVPLWRR